MPKTDIDLMSVSYSIVIPTKDRPTLLRRAVRSALAGTGTDGEVLIVDDHSKTPAADVLQDINDDRLRIIRLAPGRTGVSAARNAGLDQVAGDIVFFLDDDDEIRPDYCQQVLDAASAGHDYGFCNYLEANDRKACTRSTRVRFPHGTIPTDAPLRRQLCGFGMGFWIWRHVALEIGAIDESFSINEDTEYLCRLIQAGKKGWYSAEPGVVVHAHAGTGSDMDHLTQRTSASERARCMRAVCDRYPDMALHLGAGYIRHCLKTDAGEDAWRFVALQRDWRVRTRLRLFAATKLIGYRLSRRSRVM